MPLLARGVGDSWLWVERPKDGPNRLVVARGRQARPIAEAESITAYDADGRRAAWIARSGGRWQVSVADLDGAPPKVLWEGPEEPWGVRLAGPGVCWLRPAPAEAPGLSAFPPLGAQTEVVRADASGGPPVTVGRLREEGPGEIVGYHGGALVVAAWRIGSLGNTVFHRVPLDGEPARRLAGELGVRRGVLERDGSLVWTALSREATIEAAASCLRRLPAGGGAIQTVMEWLPAGGALFATRGGLVYVGGESRSEAWVPGRRTELPRPEPLHRDYAIVAAGERDLLLVSVAAVSGTPMLYRAPLP